MTLEESYARCRELNKRYGTTYYWSTWALPRVKRHHVWALYAFCRYADDIVDDLDDVASDVRAKALAEFGDRFFADLAAGRSDDPVLKAVVHTVRAFGHDPDCFRRFLAVDADGPDGRRVRHLGRPARLHGRLGGGHRRDDAAHPRTRSPDALPPRARSRARVPAHQLPPRRRRGPRPRPRLPAAGRSRPLRRRPAGVVRRRRRGAR